MEQKEKKVEYIELIYDLIFVYIVGRNNDLLHTIRGGFIDPSAFLTYALTALIMLQIWYYTTLFINRYGENDRMMHVGIFINMYLLYYMAQGVRVDWQSYYLQFNLAWLLILLNIAGMYFVRLRRGDQAKVWENVQIKNNIRLLLIQAAIILAAFPFYYLIKIPLSPLAMVFGIGMAVKSAGVNNLAPVEFGHLTERVMLYVVFTFGEMIIGISGYFDGGINPQTVYFSLCAFLIVTGLFMSYGYLYDHIIDRELTTNGTGYMLLHVFLLLSLNHITAALEFMREPEVGEFPKNLFLIASFAVYFVLLYYIAKYCRQEYRPERSFRFALLACLIAFIILMLLIYKNAYASIAVTVVYIASVYGMIFWYYRTHCQGDGRGQVQRKK